MAATDLMIPESVGAHLQAQLGAFLQLKQRLFTAQMLAQTPEQQGAIAELIGRQLELESQLPDVMRAVSTLSAGQLSFQDATTAATFYALMAAHLSRADIVIDGLPAAPAAIVGLDWTTLILWGGLAVGAVWLLHRTAHGLMYAALAVGGYYVWKRMGATPAVAP